MYSRYFALCLFVPVSALVLLSGCGEGGGGGGDEFIGAAEVNVRSSPSEIDTGDRTKVEVLVREVADDGIILKVRFPDGLLYVPDSSQMIVDGKKDEVRISPQSVSTSNNDTFVVYFIPQS